MNVTIDGRISLDASLSEKHSGKVEITKHPIEDGASPADHARQDPDTITLDGLFTNTHHNATTQQNRGGGGVLTFLGRPPPLGAGPMIQAQGGVGPGGAGFAQQSIDLLWQLLADRRAVTVETPTRSYQSMILTDLNVPRDAKSGDAIRFSATFEKIRFVVVKRVTLAPIPVDPKKAADPKEQGKKPGADGSGYSSTWKDGFDVLGVTHAGKGVR